MKQLFTFMAVLATALCANAQLKVTSEGQVMIGKPLESASILNAQATDSITESHVSENSITLVFPDKEADLLICGNDKEKIGGRIAFGKNLDVSISEQRPTTTNAQSYSSLLLKGKGGLIYKCDSVQILNYNPRLRIPQKMSFRST